MISEKLVTSLSHKKYRDQQGLFLIEGPDVIEHCLQHDFPIKDLLVDEALKVKFNFLVVLAHKRKVNVHVMPVQNISRLAETVTTQGVLAVAQIRRPAADDIGLAVYLDRVQDPGNVGAVIRSAAAAGFRSVIAGRDTADFYNPKVVRASAGGFANVQCIEDPTTELLKTLKSRGHNIVITDCKRGKDYRKLDRSHRNIIVMGNEGEGVSEKVEELSTDRINIPMSGAMRSLNIAVAFGVIAMNLYNPQK